MANLSTRLVSEIKSNLIIAPFVAIFGALGGYAYGKLANLPANQIAKAIAIWSVAEMAIINIACIFSENKKTQALIKVVGITLCGTIGIHEMRKRGLMGNQMMMATIGIRIFWVSLFLWEAIRQNEKSS